MTLDDYRNTFAWHQAVDLAPHLIRLAEQLPEAENAGLGGQLRILAADVPAVVAADLVTSGTNSLIVVLRTVAALEVIERVYPALDTAAARAAADELAARVHGTSFTELKVVPTPEAAVEPVEGDAADVATEPAAPSVVAVADTVAAPAPAVPVAPGDAQAPAPAAAPMSVPVLGTEPAPAAPVSVSTEAPDVHPDSPQ